MDEINYPIIMERISMRTDNSRAFTAWFVCLIFIPVFHTLSFGVLISQTSILTYIEVISDEKPQDNKKEKTNNVKWQEEEDEEQDEDCSLTTSSDDEDYR